MRWIYLSEHHWLPPIRFSHASRSSSSLPRPQPPATPRRSWRRLPSGGAGTGCSLCGAAGESSKVERAHWWLDRISAFHLRPTRCRTKHAPTGSGRPRFGVRRLARCVHLREVRTTDRGAMACGIEAISGTSGMRDECSLVADDGPSGAEGARALSRRIGGGVAEAAAVHPLQRFAARPAMGRWTLDSSPALSHGPDEPCSRPIVSIRSGSIRYAPSLGEIIDFDRLARAPILLSSPRQRAYSAASVPSATGITADVLLASACLPTMFQAYRDRTASPIGMAAMPAIRPSHRWCARATHTTPALGISIRSNAVASRSANDSSTGSNEIFLNSR